MTIRKAFVLAAIGCLLATVATAQLSTEAGSSGAANFTVPDGPVVLYDQTDNAAGNGAPDQDFEAAYDAYDSEGADDFDVDWPDGWDVSQINTIGTTGAAGGATVDIDFYADNGGTPLGGAVVCSYEDIVPGDNAGSLSIALPDVCRLPTGLHWVAIQVAQNFGTNGQHFWSNRTTQNFAGAVWRNPGGGFGTPCADWTAMTTCGVGGGTNPDFLFQVVGTLGTPQDTDISITKDGSVADGVATYTVSVTNNGPNNATGVVVTDSLPAPFIGDDCGGVDGDPWTWTVGNLDAGNTATCNIDVDVSGVPGGTTLDNVAEVTADQMNTNPDGGVSNVSSVTVGTVLDIPTLGQFGLFFLLLSLVSAGLYRLRRR